MAPSKPKLFRFINSFESSKPLFFKSQVKGGTRNLDRSQKTVTYYLCLRAICSKLIKAKEMNLLIAPQKTLKIFQSRVSLCPKVPENYE